MHKHYGDAFEATDLEEVLAERGVGRLVVTGAQTDACIRSTLHGALRPRLRRHAGRRRPHHRGPHRLGAPPPEQVIAHTNLYWSYQSAPGRRAETVDTGEVSFTGT